MMTQDMRVTAKHTLIIHEGYSKHPYIDTLGNTTIGIGYNLTDRGIDDQWIHKQCDEDMDWCFKKLFMEFGWFSYLNQARQIALLNMCYNLGWKKFLSFKRMIAALAQQNYQAVSEEMLNSLWAKQVGKRADDLANIILTGELPEHLKPTG